MKTYRELPSDMLIILVWTILSFVFIITPILKDSIIRTILGVPIVLFIPGYVSVASLFPKKTDLDTIERISLSFGLSIALVPLFGLILNFTVGIRLISILITLSIYTIILVIATVYSRNRFPENIQFSIQFNKISEIINNEIPKNKMDLILTITIMLTIILAISGIIYIITTPKMGEKFTEFYILGNSGNAENYSTELKLNSTTTLLTGVVNHEYSVVNYTIQIVLDEDILSTEKLVLKHNEIWQNNISFIPDKVGVDKKLELFLFKENNFTIPYRRLHLWTNIKA